MVSTLTSFFFLGVLGQVDPGTPSKPTLAPFFMSGAVAAGPAFFAECRNTTGATASSDSETWVLSRSAVRVDGRILDEPNGGRVGPGLTTNVDPGGRWRGIIELRQSAAGDSLAVAFGALVRMPLLVPLSVGRHTIAVRCVG